MGVEEDALGVAAEDQLADGGTPPQTDDDQLGAHLFGDGEEVLRGLEAGLGVADVDDDAGGLDSGADVVELGLGVAGPASPWWARWALTTTRSASRSRASEIEASRAASPSGLGT